MNLIDKYIRVVTAHLKEEQRDEIAKELRANINDMLDERCNGREPSKDDIDSVLIELGDPKKLADNYKGAPRFLIGEELYDIYCKVLRIALICVLIMSAIGAVTTFATEQELGSLLEAVLGIGSSLLAAFGSITLLFALLERNDIKIKDKFIWPGTPWHPDMLDKQLEQEPKKKSYDHAFEIAFDIIILMAFNLMPERLGLYYKAATGKYTVFAIFNLEELSKYIWLINIILIVSIIYHVIRLLAGRQTLGLLIFHVILKIAECVQLVLLFRFPGVWNMKLLDELNANAVLTLNDTVAYKGIEQGMNIFVGVVIVLSVIEIGKEIYRYTKVHLFMN